MHARPSVANVAASIATALLVGCAPALDWRDSSPAGTALKLQFPCKPTQQQRQVVLAGAPVTLSLAACDADGQTWGLAHADVADPALVTPALQQLRAAAMANVAAADARAADPMRVPGATPNTAATRVQLRGHLPDGKPVQAQLVVFAHGTQVFQATVLGAQLTAAGVDTYFLSMTIRP